MMHRAPKVDCEDIPDECGLSENISRKHHSKPKIGFSQQNLGRNNELKQKEEIDHEEMKRGNQPPDDYFPNEFDEYDY